MRRSKNILLYPGFLYKKSYVNFLKNLYEKKKINCDVKIFGKTILCSPLHKFGNFPDIEEIEQSDIHLISGSAFPLLPYLHKNKFSNNIILESPGFVGNLPQFLASYDHRKFNNKKPIKNIYVNNLFHNIFCTPTWQKEYDNSLKYFSEKDNLKIYTCGDSDTVADNSLAPEYLELNVFTGYHGCLFKDENNFEEMYKWISKNNYKSK